MKIQTLFSGGYLPEFDEVSFTKEKGYARKVGKLGIGGDINNDDGYTIYVNGQELSLFAKVPKKHLKFTVK